MRSPGKRDELQPQIFPVSPAADSLSQSPCMCPVPSVPLESSGRQGDLSQGPGPVHAPVPSELQAATRAFPLLHLLQGPARQAGDTLRSLLRCGQTRPFGPLIPPWALGCRALLYKL